MTLNTFTLASVIRELDPSVSAHEIIRKIKNIDLGLSVEDEFQAIITWLGRCKVCHKLENIEFHSRNFMKINIPDLFAVFEFNSIKIVTAIEVKSNSNNKLDWKAQYYDDFLSYQEAIGIPVLVAWKHNDFGIWTLNALSSFKKAVSNYHLTMEDSFKDNLLSCIAEDRAYQLCDGVGLHIESKKQSIVGNDLSSGEEIWNVLITDAWFSDSSNEKYKNIPNGIWPLFLASSLTAISTINDPVVIQEYVFKSKEEDGLSLQYLHMALPIIIKFTQSDDTIKWREMLQSDSLPVSGDELRKTLLNTIGPFTRYVISVEPSHIPEFLDAEILDKLFGKE